MEHNEPMKTGIGFVLGTWNRISKTGLLPISRPLRLAGNKSLTLHHGDAL